MASNGAAKEELSHSVFGRIKLLLCSDEAGEEILVEVLRDEQVLCGKRSGWWMKMQTQRRESMVAGETGSTFYRRQKPIYQEKSADSAPLCLIFIAISTCCLPGGRNNALAEQYLHLVFSHPPLRWLAFIRLVSRVLLSCMRAAAREAYEEIRAFTPGDTEAMPKI